MISATTTPDTASPESGQVEHQQRKRGELRDILHWLTVRAAHNRRSPGAASTDMPEQ